MTIVFIRSNAWAVWCPSRKWSHANKTNFFAANVSWIRFSLNIWSSTAEKTCFPSTAKLSILSKTTTYNTRTKTPRTPSLKGLQCLLPTLVSSVKRGCVVKDVCLFLCIFQQSDIKRAARALLINLFFSSPFLTKYFEEPVLKRTLWCWHFDVVVTCKQCCIVYVTMTATNASGFFTFNWKFESFRELKCSSPIRFNHHQV